LFFQPALLEFAMELRLKLQPGIEDSYTMQPRRSQLLSPNALAAKLISESSTWNGEVRITTNVYEKDSNWWMPLLPPNHPPGLPNVEDEPVGSV
jgi:hypothetical protein